MDDLAHLAHLSFIAALRLNGILYTVLHRFVCDFDMDVLSTPQSRRALQNLLDVLAFLDLVPEVPPGSRDTCAYFRRTAHEYLLMVFYHVPHRARRDDLGLQHFESDRSS